jgi:hypothetical protein
LEQRSSVFVFELVAGEILVMYSDALESHSGGLPKQNPHPNCQLPVGKIVVIQLPSHAT